MAFVSPRSLSGIFALTLVSSALLLASGCKSNSGSAAIASAACMDPSASVVITDPTNYTLSDSFMLDHVVLQDDYDLVIDWSQLSVDFFGQPVNPLTDVNTVSISLWQLTPSDIEQALKIDDLNNMLPKMAGIMTTYPDGTYTHMDLLGFNELGNPLPTNELWARFDTATPMYQYPQDQYTFLAMAQTGTDIGKKPRAVALFNIDPSSTTQQLNLTNDSTKLTYSVDLEHARPVLVPAGVPRLTIDWSQMMTNCLGNPYDGSQITSAAVAHFANKTLPELQQQFLNLENIADDWWTGLPPAGRTVDLSTLTDANGATFPGIDDSGVWMAALFCGNCNNPAPWSITILESCQ